MPEWRDDLDVLDAFPIAEIKSPLQRKYSEVSGGLFSAMRMHWSYEK